MAIAYNIYANNGAGGPVNYSQPIATTSSLSYVPGALTPSSDTTFAVRAKDTVSNLEEANTDARIRIVLDGSGNDLSGVPNSPQSVVLSALAGGDCLVTWAYIPALSAGVPTRFQIYLSQGQTVNYGSPTMTVPYVPGQVGFTCKLAGPFAFSSYSASVRAVNDAGSDGNTTCSQAFAGLPTSTVAMDRITVSFI
jgi:hypothetical protein